MMHFKSQLYNKGADISPLYEDQIFHGPAMTNHIYILISGKERFKYAQQEQPQPYALCVTFSYDSEENIDLYNQLRNNVRLKEIEKIRTKIKL